MCMNRRIVCAACKNANTGVIIAGVRHWDNIMRSHIKTGISHSEWEQGFLDNKYEFHNRTDAWKIAMDADQIIRRCGGDTANGGTLYSENLY